MPSWQRSFATSSPTSRTKYSKASADGEKCRLGCLAVIVCVCIFKTKSACELSHNVSVYSTLIGILNSHKFDLGEEVRVFLCHMVEGSFGLVHVHLVAGPAV